MFSNDLRKMKVGFEAALLLILYLWLRSVGVARLIGLVYDGDGGLVGKIHNPDFVPALLRQFLRTCERCFVAIDTHTPDELATFHLKNVVGS